MELKSRKAVLPPHNPCRPHQSQVREKPLPQAVPLSMFCRSVQSLRVASPLSWPLNWEEQPRRDLWRKSSPSTAGELSLPGHLEEKLHWRSAACRPSQAGGQTRFIIYLKDRLVTYPRVTAGMTSCASASPMALRHQALTSLTRSAPLSLLTAGSSSISLLQTEEQPGTKSITHNWNSYWSHQ